MVTFIIISSVLATLALIIAGIRAIQILIEDDKKNKFSQKSSEQLFDNPEFVTIRKDVLLNLLFEKDKLQDVVQTALKNYSNEADSVERIINPNMDNEDSYSNVDKETLFNYEKSTSN